MNKIIARWSETIAVGAVDNHDEWQYWSTRGDDFDLVAPSEWIYTLSNLDENNFDEYWYGPALSTEYVAGTVSLLKSVDPTLTPEEVRTLLIESAEDMVGDSTYDIPGFERFNGWGRLNAYCALDQLSGVEENQVQLPSGIYIYQMKAGAFSETKKMSLMK